MALTAKKLDQVRPTVPVEEIGKGETVRININVAESTRKTWKKAAIERDTTVTEMIEAAVSEYLRKGVSEETSNGASEHRSKGASEGMRS